ncbi:MULTISPECIES: IPExxxVDY family protein [Flavobacteriaceae]|uniref:IPExxxVDY family protein n=1 Tax=Flavobacteriaceae TaxID=49546 RepID=UPI001492C2C9|nr:MULTISPECIES: IPExxxVDY family protein [Allomuricauda]MDC6365262.1 IPExxxVDY family protein [Muricauda sp. AC10]
MLTTHKISADFYDDNFELIAIHSSLEDYAMAYAINSTCGLHLKRMNNDLQINESHTFSVFDWEDDINDMYWTLISNTCVVEEVVPSEGFFENRTSLRTFHLMEERKEVDFFLKIDMSDEPLIDEKSKAINRIPKVITAYPIETKTLKSKRNLIF